MARLWCSGLGTVGAPPRAITAKVTEDHRGSRASAISGNARCSSVLRVLCGIRFLADGGKIIVFVDTDALSGGTTRLVARMVFS